MVRAEVIVCCRSCLIISAESITSGEVVAGAEIPDVVRKLEPVSNGNCHHKNGSAFKWAAALPPFPVPLIAVNRVNRQEEINLFTDPTQIFFSELKSTHGSLQRDNLSGLFKPAFSTVCVLWFVWTTSTMFTYCLRVFLLIFLHAERSRISNFTHFCPAYMAFMYARR